MGPCHHGMVHPQDADGGTAFNMEGSCEYVDKQSRTADKGWYSSLGLGRGAKKTGIVTKHTHVSRAWTDTSVRPKQWKRDMRFRTWNKTVLQEVGWGVLTGLIWLRGGTGGEHL
jgi:hypothetical protein